MQILTMAWRNIWRNGRRTTVTVAAMALALFVTVMWSSLIQGYLENMESTLLDMEMGEIQVFADDYRNSPSIYSRIEDPDALLQELESQGLRGTARLLGGGLVATRESSAGASLHGIEVERDARVSLIHEQVDRGSWLSVDDPRGVVLGRQLARTLAVDVGDELVLLSQATDGSMANDLFSVRGVLRSISSGTDRAGIFLLDDEFRAFFGLEDGAHQVIVRKPLGDDLEQATQVVAEAAPGLDVKSWRQLEPTLASMLDSARAAMSLMFMVVYIAVGILILNAMLMAVFERIREFGLLKAVGFDPGKVSTMIFIEGGLQTVIAMVIALTLSVPGLWALTKYGIPLDVLTGDLILMGLAVDPNWRGSVSPMTFVGPIVGLVFIVGLAILYPARKAARISPIDAMRYQ